MHAHAPQVRVIEVEAVRAFAATVCSLARSQCDRVRGYCPFSSICILKVVQPLPKATVALCQPLRWCNPVVGAELFCVSSPFGDSNAKLLYGQCITRGMCCAVSTDGAVAVTDLRCLPGSQGAVVTDYTGDVCGVLLSALPTDSALRTSSLDSLLAPPPVPLLASMSYVLSSSVVRDCLTALVQAQDQILPLPPQSSLRQLALPVPCASSGTTLSSPSPPVHIQTALASVYAVRTPHQFCTAVAVDDVHNVFVTCAHGLDDGTSVQLRSHHSSACETRSGSGWFDVTVAFRGNDAFDVAVLVRAQSGPSGADSEAASHDSHRKSCKQPFESPRLSQHIRNGVALLRDAGSLALNGLPVFGCGYGSIPPWLSVFTSPLVTSGCISKHVTANRCSGVSPSILLQCTVTVLPGASGGPLFYYDADADRLSILGIMTSIASLSGQGRGHRKRTAAPLVFPNASYCIPITPLVELIPVAVSGDSSATAAVVARVWDAQVQSVWIATGASSKL